jgi:hypothetical protein
MPSTSLFPIRHTADNEGNDQTLGGDKKRFQVARNGDHLMCPYHQCNLCHFCNIQKRDPMPGNRKDKFLLQCIRQASLDAFWGPEPSSTVRANLSGANQLESIGESVGILGVSPPLGPYSTDDTMGMGLAVCILICT